MGYGLVFELFEVVLDDDVGDGVKDELDVVGVRGARKMRVNLFRLAAFVQVLELFHDAKLQEIFFAFYSQTPCTDIRAQ